MKGSEKMAVYIATFIFVLIGDLVFMIISEVLSDFIFDLNIPFLTVARTGSLITAFGWFLVCFLTAWGASHWIEQGEKIGILSLTFFILWFIASLAVVIAFVVRNLLEGSTLSINLDAIIDSLFFAFLYSIGPAVSALLGISNKK